MRPTPEQRKEKLHQSTIHRIFKNLDCSGECWIWTGPTFYTNKKSPGCIAAKFNGYDPEADTYVGWSPTAILFEELTGVDPRGQFLVSSCYNSLCCNPAHHRLVDRRGLGQYAREKSKLKRLAALSSDPKAC